MRPRDREARAHALFNQAADLEVSERASFLDRTCGDDPALRHEVDDLLRGLDDSSSFLDRPAIAAAPATWREAIDERLVGRRVGRYLITSVLGRGGMSTVYLAEQDNPRRTVALKIIRAQRGVQRIQHEAEVLARMRHPYIAQVYDAGTHDLEQACVPYVALEYVEDAQSITAYARDRDLDLDARLDLFVKVCEAVQHGHQGGVVHRDLKPGNVLVDPAIGAPKIIDFGIACAAGEGDEAQDVIGTISYMSPERCAGDEHTDTRSDVYALGVLLYDLLCDARPHDVSTLQPSKALRVIRETPPRPPSALVPSLRGDLELIMLKAVASSRDARYDSAAALGADIQRFREARPIEARSASAAYTARLFTRRHAAACTAGAGAILTLIAATVVSIVFALEARSERDALEWRTYVGDIARAQLACVHDDVDGMRAALADAPEARRGWEWRCLDALTEQSIERFGPVDGLGRSLAVSEDETLLALGDEKGRVTIWDRSTRESRSTHAHVGRVIDVAFAEFGLLSAGDDGAVSVWSLDSLEPLCELARLDVGVLLVGPANDGSGVIVVAKDGSLRVIERESGAIRYVTSSAVADPFAATVSADGRLVAIGGEHGSVALHDAATGRHLRSFEGATSRIVGVAIDPRAERITACALREPSLQWRVDDGALLSTIESEANPVSVSYTCDGKRLLFGKAGTLYVVDAATGKLLMTRLGHERRITEIVPLRDDRHVLTSSWDSTVRLWEFTADGNDRLHDHANKVRAVAYTPAGDRFATSDEDGTVIVWDPATVERLFTIRLERGEAHAVTFSPCGRFLATGSFGIHMWDAATGELVWARPLDFEIWSVAFLPEGDRLVSGGKDRRVRLWDVSNGDELETLMHFDERANEVAVSACGTRIAAGSRDHTFRIYDLLERRELDIERQYDLDVLSVAVDASGRLFASSGRQGKAHVWDAVSGEVTVTVNLHAATLTSTAFHPDGTRLAIGEWSGRLRIVDAMTGEILLTLPAHELPIWDMAFSPDGEQLVTVSLDGSVRLWHTDRTGERRRASEAILARASEAAALLDELETEHDAPADVVAALDAASDLDPALLRAARNEVLRRAGQISCGTSAVASPSVVSTAPGPS